MHTSSAVDAADTYIEKISRKKMGLIMNMTASQNQR
jgi:hypothetical protein